MKIVCPNCQKTKSVKERARGQQMYCCNKCSDEFSKVKITQAFRDRIKNYLIDKSITICQLAYISGVSHQAIYELLNKNYKNYNKPMRLDTIDKICSGMGEPMAMLERWGELINKYFIRQVEK